MITLKELELLFDSGSFVELGERQECSLIAGYGTVGGKLCYAFLQDSERAGGAFGKTAGAKIVRLYNLALKSKAPIVGFLDSTGFLVDEGAEALNAFSEVYRAAYCAKNDILQIMIIGGKCLGQMRSLANMGDFLIRDVDMEEALMTVKEIVRVMPPARGMLPEQFDNMDDLNRLNPDIFGKIESGREVLREISDEGFLLEAEGDIAPEIICGFIKINGLMVAAISSNHEINGGRLSYKGMIKAKRLIDTAQKFSLGILNVSNTEGFLTDEDQILVAQAAQELSSAFIGADVPKVNLITGGVTGGIYSVMNGRNAMSDLTFLWEGARVNIIDPLQAAELVYGPLDAAEAESKAKEYEESHSTAETLEKLGLLDKVIRPEETRKYLAGAFETYANVF